MFDLFLITNTHPHSKKRSYNKSTFALCCCNCLSWNFFFISNSVTIKLLKDSRTLCRFKNIFKKNWIVFIYLFLSLYQRPEQSRVILLFLCVHRFVIEIEIELCINIYDLTVCVCVYSFVYFLLHWILKKLIRNFKLYIKWKCIWCLIIIIKQAQWDCVSIWYVCLFANGTNWTNRRKYYNINKLIK